MKLTDQELRKLRDAYNVQKKTQRRRKPDRNGHRIQVTMTFEEWLQVWTESGKLHLAAAGVVFLVGGSRVQRVRGWEKDPDWKLQTTERWTVPGLVEAVRTAGVPSGQGWTANPDAGKK